jgi:signal transduction histidine kinase
VDLVFSHTWPSDLKLRFDLLLMRKVILILFQNALEALEGAPGQITVRLYPSAKVAHLEIEDTGKGIEPQHLAQLFSPFFTTKPKALGMGLTKAERIVAKHGGRLRIEPAGSQGTRVCLDLPLVFNTRALPRKDRAPAAKPLDDQNPAN